MIRKRKVQKSRRKTPAKSPTEKLERVQMNPEWKAELLVVLRARKARGERPGNKAQLAEALGVSRGHVTKMLKEQTASELVPAILRILPELGPPAVRIDQQTLYVSQRLLGRTPEQLDRLLALDAAAEGATPEAIAAVVTLLESQKKNP